MRDLLVAAAVAASLSLVACDEEESCAPNTEVACECDDGSEGTRYCLSNRTFDDCYCADEIWGSDDPPPPPPVKRDAGQTGTVPIVRLDAGSILDTFFRDAGMDASVDAAAPTPSDGRTLVTGPGQLIDVFARGKDVWLVVPDRVVRISLEDGSELAHWDAPRTLTSAAFDGERLAVLDGAKATLLDANELTSKLSTNLVEPCAGAALLAGGPLVCASSAFNGGTYVIDMVSGAQQSSTHAVRGTKLVTVPGTMRVVALNSPTSSAAQAIEIEPDGGALTVLDAGSFSASGVVSTVLAFDSVPAQNLVNSQGVMLRMDAKCSTSSEACLTRTGTLGLLQTQEAFVAMDTVSDGMFGLLDPTNSSGVSSPRCSAQPCRLLDIDVTGRTIRVEQSVRHPLRNVIAMHVLREQKAAVMAIAAVGNDKYYSSFADAGYEVVRLDIKAKE